MVLNTLSNVGIFGEAGTFGFQLKPESADISAKRDRVKPFFVKPFNNVCFQARDAGKYRYCYEKKKRKDLTFNFCYVRKKWILK
jgi:hypothetical protein